MGEGEHEPRVSVMIAVLLAVFAVLAARLWQLQVLQGETYAQLAEGNYLRRFPSDAPRGRIFDRNGVLLAGNRYAYTVSAIPRLFDAHDTAYLTQLSQLLDMTPAAVLAKLHEGDARPDVPVRLKRDVPPDVVIAIEEHRAEHPETLIQREPVRFYRYAALAGDLIGYMGPVDADELAAHPDYRVTDLIGKAGLERKYESFLRGKPGSTDVEVDARGRRVALLGQTAPVPGYDLHLTIDAKLQLAAEAALQKEIAALRKSGDAPDAAGGAVVVLDPHTGELLALATEPAIDPNHFVASDRSSYYLSLLAPAAHQPLINRATTSFSPGSTFKVVTSLAALETGAITPDWMYNANGIGPYGKRDWTLRHNPPLPPAGRIDVRGALAQSSDDFFWKVAGLPEMGIEPLSQWARALGFGQPTGLNLPEQIGIVPDPEWKARQASNPSSGITDPNWYDAETMDLAIGEGYVEATPLQMADAYAAIVNNGAILRPHLLAKVSDRGGEVALATGPELIHQVKAKPSSWQTLREGLREVVTDPRGTAYGAFYQFPVPVIGKTGSAETTHGSAEGWFAGAAPAYDPQIVVVAFVQHGASGAGAAAPVARDVFAAYFNIGKQVDLAAVAKEVARP
ncbi:MAG TPA: penicillin-binding protein 2 [Limnochordia bacterium]|nr:penicillin-binding protein 2 [Limnochordia bacterium]